MEPITIRSLQSADEPTFVEALTDLLESAVREGHSLEFLSGTERESLLRYWRGVFGSLSLDRHLWVALSGAQVVGTAQLSRCTKANGRHRADVMKVITNQEFRGQGIGRRLLEQLEVEAKRLGVTLLILDTERDSPASAFYQKQGWSVSGHIPDYALNTQGELIATTYFYKLLV